jgi:hypothetical protein
MNGGKRGRARVVGGKGREETSAFYQTSPKDTFGQYQTAEGKEDKAGRQGVEGGCGASGRGRKIRGDGGVDTDADIWLG